jgi:DNA-binding response OmpR family regulator
MEAGKILVIEDEATIRSFIVTRLTRDGFVVRAAVSGEEGLTLAAEDTPNAVVLDLRLPGMSGFEVCARLRESHPQVAILMLTALVQPDDRVTGLEAGADDYIAKPFEPRELAARIRAVLRRTAAAREMSPDVRRIGSLVVDLAARRVWRSGAEIGLSPKEYALLEFFVRRPGRAFDRNDILDAVWGEEYLGDPKTLDVHVRRLREKLEDDPANPVFFETVRGTGYRLGHVSAYSTLD